MGKLNDKIALVTGTSKGLGAGIAERFGADGAKVVVNYASSAEQADQVVARIEAAGGSAFAIQADVSKPENITRLFSEAKERFGRLDILVNNAGLARPALLQDVTPESIDEHYALNVGATILATQAAVRLRPRCS